MVFPVITVLGRSELTCAVWDAKSWNVSIDCYAVCTGSVVQCHLCLPSGSKREMMTRPNGLPLCLKKTSKSLMIFSAPSLEMEAGLVLRVKLTIGGYDAVVDKHLSEDNAWLFWSQVCLAENISALLISSLLSWEHQCWLDQNILLVCASYT